MAVFLVGAAGIELPSLEPESSRNVAKTSELASSNSPGVTVGDDSPGPEAVPTSPIAVSAGIDDAIFAAFRLARAAGDVDRARALLDLLDPKSSAGEAAGVTPLSLVRGQLGGR